MSVRQAAEVYHLPKSTIHDAFYAPLLPCVAPQHRRTLTESEELRIVDLLVKHADIGHPLSIRHVQDAVQVVVSRMIPIRRMHLPFKVGKPGIKYLRSFLKRYSDKLKFVRPTRQEHLRFRAVNADILCEHFAALEKLIKENNLHSDRIWNLDECGVTPGKDTVGRSQKKRITRRGGGQDVQTTSFLYENRITLMPVISASGESVPCLFVLKEKRFPYRRFLEDGSERIDTIAHHLPYLSVVGMREEGGGVDGKNFLIWAQHFVRYVSPMTQNGSKVLLIYDGYRSHMSLEVLILFRQNSVIVYALPAHSSGRLQPLDVVAFSVFKRNLNEVVHNSPGMFGERGANVFDVCDMIRKAYCDTFTSDVICQSFARAGVWPLNPKKLMDVPRPQDSSLTEVVTVEAMEEMLKVRREEYSQTVFGKRVTLLGNGYVDTTKGAVLTFSEAMHLIEEKAIALEKIKKRERIEKERREEKAYLKQEANRRRLMVIREEVDSRRAAMANMDVGEYRQQLRSLGTRRAAARLRAAQKRLQLEP